MMRCERHEGLERDVAAEVFQMSKSCIASALVGVRVGYVGRLLNAVG